MGSPGTGAGERGAGEPTDETISVPWYRRRQGLAVFTLDVLLVVVVAFGTTGIASSVLARVGIEWTSVVTIEPFVYLFSVLGALGYVFTALVKEFDRTTKDLFDYNVRLFAALPLAAGISLLSELLFGDVPSNELLAGLAFIAGLYVNLAYERIGSVAERLLQSNET